MLKKLLMASLIIWAVITLGNGVYAAEFSDVAEDAWYYNDVCQAYEKGLISGMTEDTFAPDASVTYAQFITLLVKEKFGEQPPPAAGKHWAYSYIIKAMESGIVVPQKEVPGWDEKITRGRMSMFMIRSLDIKPEERIEPIFADSMYNNDYYPYLLKAYKEYLTDGTGFGTGTAFMRRTTDSSKPVTRAQLASMILRIEKFRNDPAAFKEEQAKAREAADAKRLIEYNEYLGANLKLQKTHDYLLFFCEDKDVRVLDDLLKVLESNEEKITSVLKNSFDQKVRIFVYPNIEVLHKAMGRPDAPNGVAGVAWYNEIKMVSPLNPGSAKAYQTAVQTVVHEFVHVATFNIFDCRKKLPSWFMEGFATYMSGQNYSTTVIKNNIPSLDELESSENSAYGTGYVYGFGRTIIEFIVNKFDMNKTQEFIRNPDFDTVFGMSRQEFESQWIKYVQDNYKK